VEADRDFASEAEMVTHRDDGVGVVDAENDEGRRIDVLPFFAGAAFGGKLVRADDVLGAEVADPSP